MALEITTNNHPRELLCRADLPAKAAAYFDYVNEEESYSPRFVRYRGEWYDVEDTMSTRELLPECGHHDLRGWHRYISDTFFSGVVFRYVDDFERVICGRFYATGDGE